MNDKEYTKKYFATLPVVYAIFNEIYPIPPKTNREWAEGFNIRGRIMNILLDNEDLWKNTTKKTH